MKYRIQVLVDAERLPVVIEAAFRGELQYDPELKVWPALTPRDEAIHALHSGLQRVEPKPQKAARSGNSKSNNRQMLVEAALKTGPKRWGDLRTALSAGGLSQSSLNSLISKWQKVGKISRSADGLWSLNDATTQRADAG
jgi:hypothetical protein